MSRNAAELKSALHAIVSLREEFWKDVNVPGSDAELNQALEKAGRVADFFELAELLCIDALHRTEPNRADAIFAKRARRKTERQSATTSASPTSPYGLMPARTTDRCCARSRSSSRP